MTRRAGPTQIVVPIVAARAVVLAIAAVVVLAVLVAASALARANEPRVVAAAADMRVQQTAAERDVERAYEAATAQVAKVRALNLAITAAQADQIATKAVADLRALRHSAFVSLAQVAGTVGPEADAYASAAEQRFDATPVARLPTPSPVLLAPRYYTIVSRMSELATQLSDNATNALTASPAAPSPTPRPSPSPSPSR